MYNHVNLESLQINLLNVRLMKAEFTISVHR